MEARTRTYTTQQKTPIDLSPRSVPPYGHTTNEDKMLALSLTFLSSDQAHAFASYLRAQNVDDNLVNLLVEV